MPKPAAGEVTRGINWLVHQRLVSPAIAQAAGREILTAIAVRHPMVKYDYHYKNEGLVGYQIRGWSRLSPDDITAPTFAFPSLLKVREAFTPFKNAAELADPRSRYYDVGYVNITAPRGVVMRHRDSEPHSLIFASLLETAEVRIKHLDEPEWSIHALIPGAALEITNPTAARQRPEHEVTNVSDAVRVSYGEYL